MDCASSYSDEGFWEKMRKGLRHTAKECIEPAVLLYYAAREPGTPAWARSVIFGTLGYLICPVDAIPDLAPVIGYTDDVGVLLGAVATCAMHINDNVRRKAGEVIQTLFG